MKLKVRQEKALSMLATRCMEAETIVPENMDVYRLAMEGVKLAVNNALASGVPVALITACIKYYSQYDAYRHATWDEFCEVNNIDK